MLDKTLSTIIQIFEENKNRKRKQMRLFLKAALEALTETRIYIGHNVRDRTKEERLARLWSKVALTAQPLNPDLAGRYQIKANYWANPDRWTDEEIEEAKIEIERIEKEINNYFKGKLKAKKKTRK